MWRLILQLTVRVLLCVYLLVSPILSHNAWAGCSHVWATYSWSCALSLAAMVFMMWRYLHNRGDMMEWIVSHEHAYMFYQLFLCAASAFWVGLIALFYVRFEGCGCTQHAKQLVLWHVTSQVVMYLWDVSTNECAMERFKPGPLID